MENESTPRKNKPGGGRPVGSQNVVNRNIRRDLEVIYSKGIPAMKRFLEKSIREEDITNFLAIMGMIGKKVIADKKDVDNDGSSDTKIQIKVIRD